MGCRNQSKKKKKKLMGCPWVLDSTVGELLLEWVGGPFLGRWGVAWKPIPSVIFWSVWKERNKRIFDRKKGGVRGVSERAKWNLVSWLSLGKEFSRYSMEEFYLSWEGCMKGVGEVENLRWHGKTGVWLL